MPSIFKKVFITPSLCPHGLYHQPQRQHSHGPMKQIARQGFDIRQLTAENFRHQISNSDKRKQPGCSRPNPPPHSSLPEKKMIRYLFRRNRHILNYTISRSTILVFFPPPGKMCHCECVSFVSLQAFFAKQSQRVLSERSLQSSHNSRPWVETASPIDLAQMRRQKQLGFLGCTASHRQSLSPSPKIHAFRILGSHSMP